MNTVPNPTDTPQSTACPTHPWCSVDHSLSYEDDDYHYSDLIPVGPVNLRLDQGTVGGTAVEIVTEHADGDRLTLDDLDALMARLADLRPALVAATLPAGAR